MSRISKIEKLANLYEDLAKDSAHIFILFIDLCDSTEYKQYLIENDLSDNIWLHRQLIFLQIVADHFKKNGGTIIKTIGDSVMCSFDYNNSAEEILSISINLLMKLKNLKSFVNKEKLNAKISIDFGETINGNVIDKSYDPLGLCVDRCARLNSEATSNEIVCSSSFLKKLKNSIIEDIHPNIIESKQISIELKGLGRVKIGKISIK